MKKIGGCDKAARASRWLVLAAVMAALSACATGDVQKAMSVTGQALLQAGKQFEATSAAFKVGCDSGAIKADACSEFGAFQQSFKKAYRPAVQAWKDAVAEGDVAAAQGAQETVAVLSAYLAKYTAIAITLSGGK